MPVNVYLAVMVAIILFITLISVPSLFLKKCPQCGRRNPVDAAECKACGGELPIDEDEE